MNHSHPDELNSLPAWKPPASILPPSVDHGHEDVPPLRLYKPPAEDTAKPAPLESEKSDTLARISTVGIACAVGLLALFNFTKSGPETKLPETRHRTSPGLPPLPVEPGESAPTQEQMHGQKMQKLLNDRRQEIHDKIYR